MNIKPQNVLDYHGNNAIFMVWNFKEDMDVNDAFRKVCKLVINLNNSADALYPDSGTSCVMGISHDAWINLQLPDPLPRELENFLPIVGEKHTAISSKGDLHFHIRGNDISMCYDMAHTISDVLETVATSIEEIHGFRYWDGRTILGFVDGTENPHQNEREYFGLVGDSDPAYRGGSYLFVQKYIHDLTAFEKLSTEDQEKVFGRYKLTDVEMPENI